MQITKDTKQEEISAETKHLLDYATVPEVEYSKGTANAENSKDFKYFLNLVNANLLTEAPKYVYIRELNPGRFTESGDSGLWPSIEDAIEANRLPLCDLVEYDDAEIDVSCCLLHAQQNVVDMLHRSFQCLFCIL